MISNGKKPFDTLSVGSCYLDLNLINFPFTHGLKTETETVGGKYVLEPGGSALIFSRIGSSLGLKPVFIGKIGKDLAGEILKRLIEAEQIEPALIESDQVQTNISPQFINAKGETLMTVAGSANQSLKPEEVMDIFTQYIDKVRYLYLGGYFKMKSLSFYFPKMISKAKENQVKVIIDHGRVTNVVSSDELENLKKLIESVDIYLPSKDEFEKVWDFKDIKAGLLEFHRQLPNINIVVKQAAKGAVMIADGKPVLVSAYPVKPVNTVGAGDGFNAGFIKARTEGLNGKDAVSFANAAAAVQISQEGLPDHHKVVELYSKSK